MNVNMEGRDTVMTDAPLPNVQVTQETKDTHVILTTLINPEGQQHNSFVSTGFVSNMLNPRPDTGIDSIFTLNTEATSLIDVLVTTIVEPPLVSATTLPPPPTPLIIHMKQTPVPTPITVPSTSLQDLPNFGSLFGFDHRLKTLETDFSEFKQTNQFAEAVSSIPDIVDAYLANKMKSDKKILIDKMESNKSIHKSDEQKNLYKALVEAYESDKLILDTYGDTVSFKRRRDDEDKDEEPSARSNRGSKRRRTGKEPESTSTPKEKTPKSTGKSTKGSKSLHKSTSESAHAEEPMHTAKDLEEPAHQEFKTRATKDQVVDETLQPSKWFQKPTRLLSPVLDWNKTWPADHGPVQSWLSNLAQEEGPRESFDELVDTPLDFSSFMINQLKVDTLTPELLADPTFELMKGTCKSLVELDYFFEEVYKATTDQLDWNNPEGQQYPHDL
ncbi:hypothetical protein Tco_0817969 [Tanacetum coccineum]